MMSFSQEIKEELTGVRLRRESDANMLTAGYTLAAASLKYSREHGQWGLHYVSESTTAINFIAKLACKSYELEQETVLNVHQRLNARNTELLLYGRGVDSLCLDSGLMSYDENGDKSFATVLPKGLESEHLCRAFIRGVFLACGTVSDPATGCRAELVLRSEFLAREIQRLLSERDIPPKLTNRKHMWIVYFKNGDMVEDFLTFMGAGEAMLKVREYRMIREVKNNSNREVNCFSANMEKTARASAVQSENIRLVMTELGADALSEELYEVASARMEEPELTLSQLAQKLGIGKSAVNYRLKRIAAIADDIRNGRGL